MAHNWRNRAASALAAEYVESFETPSEPAVPPRHCLVMEDEDASLVQELRAHGWKVTQWWRRAYGGRPASPWPPAGPFDLVALRWPVAKEEGDMVLEAARGVLAATGRVLVYGAKDEGVGSLQGRLLERFAEVKTGRVGKHCRVLEVGAPKPSAEVAGLAPFGEWIDLGLSEIPGRWRSFPGVFAHGRLDGGTRLLIEHLPRVPKAARVLDFGCGHGVLGGIVQARQPEVVLDLLDVDSVALEAARENIPEAGRILSDGWPEGEMEPYQLVVSNPPIHRGKAETLEAVQGLIKEAPHRMEQRGLLYLVVQRRFGVERFLKASFDSVENVADEGPWRVWSGQYPRRNPAGDHRPARRRREEESLSPRHDGV